MRLKIRKFINSIGSRGLYGTARWMFYGYLTVNKFLVFHRNLSTVPDIASPGKHIVFKEISVDELDNIRKTHDNLPVEFFCDITFGFTKPYVAYVNGRLAAIHWLVPAGEYSRFLNLVDGDVELNYTTVLPEFRGHSLSMHFLNHLLHFCRDQGYKHMFASINVSNIPQYKPMLRLGFEPVEVLTHFSLYRPKAGLKHLKR